MDIFEGKKVFENEQEKHLWEQVILAGINIMRRDTNIDYADTIIEAYRIRNLKLKENS